MLDVSARLRAAAQKAKEVSDAYELGRRWARKYAERSVLQELDAVFGNTTNFYIDLPNTAYSPGEKFFFVISPERNGDREAAEEFWNGVIPEAKRLSAGAAWMNSFVGGALEVWAEVKDQI